MRPKPLLAAVAVLTVLALIVRQVTLAVKHTFSARSGVAVLDKSTPDEQNGLTLMEIDNVSPDRSYSYTDKGPQDIGGSSQFTAADTGLWIKMPPGFSVPPTCPDSSYNGCGTVLSATAHLSDGETVPLRWRMRDASDQSDQKYLLVSIPAGYPNTVRWADVTLDDKQGNKATWRITHLPPMQHILAPPITPQTTFHQGNIRAVARAYRGVNRYGNTHEPMILCDIQGSIGGAAHQWELGHLTQMREWEPPGFVAQEAGMTMGEGKIGSNVNFQMEQQAIPNDQTPMPYLNDTHWVRLSAMLQEFETYDETVTFHNLSVVKTKDGAHYLAGSGPQTVTTPSGVTVTLDDVQHHPYNNEWGDDGGYSVHLLYPQTAHLASLGSSPLWRKYKRPIIVSAGIPKPYEANGSSSGNSEGTYHFRAKAPLPKVIANFLVIIHQRVDLGTVPMTFTLPVLPKEPKQALVQP